MGGSEGTRRQRGIHASISYLPVAKRALVSNRGPLGCSFLAPARTFSRRDGTRSRPCVELLDRVLDYLGSWLGTRVASLGCPGPRLSASRHHRTGGAK